eukprot:2341151-Pyramimonas_sp.AAC.1
MTIDGITYATFALATHALTMLPSGEIDVLGIRADDILILEGTQINERCHSFLNPDASHDTVEELVISTDRPERATKPMPLFFRACQGRSCFAHSIERMHAPCEFGMA